jgi:general secretion pathway protein G
MTTPRPMSTSADPPGGCGPAWERPGARPAGEWPTDELVPNLSSARKGLRARGFTLIELLVVLALIGLMLSIAAPRTVDHIERARETTLKATLKELRHALDQFEADRGRPPQTLDELVAQRYLRELPVDPFTERRDTWVTLTPEEARPPDAMAPAGPPAQGVADVRSGADGQGRDGTPFNTW